MRTSQLAMLIAGRWLVQSQGALELITTTPFLVTNTALQQLRCTCPPIGANSHAPLLLRSGL